MSDDKKVDYDFAAHEKAVFDAWMKGGYFSRSVARPGSAEGTYTITIPPPNVTGQLHMGHALNDTIQDACIRHARMQGYATRWILGTDHAGIATQTKVDKYLSEQGINRREIGREAFIDECWKWRTEYGNTIVEQIKSMGCSCDYDGERFTLDDDYAAAVRRVFVDWYHSGLIYRGKRIVNWCPDCTTAIADDEAEYVDEHGKLWYLRYPLTTPVDGHDYIVVATTRPETMLGDTGVAVSPKDPEKAAFVGATVELPLVGRTIPIFSDFFVDAGFGTGFVKVTPAHDPNDWGMGERHDLEKINIFDETAHVVEGYGKYSGMDRDEARDAIVADFEAAGLLDHIEDHDHSVMTCYRCHTKLEPWLSEQWFVDVSKLKSDAARVVEDDEIRFHPTRWKQVYLDWLENLKDWCISRQLWWGHRIPMFYCDECGWEDALLEDADVCPKCGAPLRRDEDVLDTWFSSQLWPFATMGWSRVDEATPELDLAYPTQVLSTARDIMGLWVARMVMSSMYFTGKIPFENVIIHPTVMAADGKPMSKSRGNGVNPIDMMEAYGADGMRFGLLMQVTGAQDMRFDESKLESSRNFANKIRNAARFVGMNLEGYTPGEPEPVTLPDKWIFSRLAGLVARIDEGYDAFEFGEITRALYAFFWNEFCDWYIEFSKARLSDGSPEERLACQRNLMFVLDNALRLLHPIMPFVTEEIYQELPFERGEGHLIVAPWPEASTLSRFADPHAEAAIGTVTDTISAIRAVRARYSISPKRQMGVVIRTTDEDYAAVGTEGADLMCDLANLDPFSMGTTVSKPAQSSVSVVGSSEVFCDLSGLVDFDAERERLNREATELERDAAKLDKKLSNPGFLAKAAPEIIAKDTAKRDDLTAKLELVKEQLRQMG